jgi:predicted transcriptional regulator
MKESTKKNVENALALFKQNLGYKEIALQMNRPEGTIRRWLAPYGLFGDMKEALKGYGVKGRTKLVEKYELLRRQAYEEAYKNIHEDLKDPLLRDFINIYIGEGSKRRGTVIAVTNSDSKVILLSLMIIKKYFLKEGKKINFEIRYYKENNNEEELLNYWKNIIGVNDYIKIKTYEQPTVKAIGHNNSNKFGLLRAEVNDTYARQKLNAYMDYLKEEWTKEFEAVFNTKVDRTITKVKAKEFIPSIPTARIKKHTKKVVSYPPLPLLKQMVAEKGYSQVAQELGCSLEAVRKHIFRNDTEHIKVEKKKVTYPDVNVLITMVIEKGFVQVGKELGCSDNAIRKYLKKNNIDINTIVINKSINTAIKNDNYNYS